MTFATDIEDEAKDESIEAVVIGDFGWDGYSEEGRDQEITKSTVLTWAEARPMLDYEYDTSYGAPECHAIYAWTATRVLFVGKYDGSTWVQSIPRNPGICEPAMAGGG